MAWMDGWMAGCSRRCEKVAKLHGAWLACMALASKPDPRLAGWDPRFQTMHRSRKEGEGDTPIKEGNKIGTMSGQNA